MLSSLLLHLEGDDLLGVVVHNGVELAGRHAARLRGLVIVNAPRPCRLTESEVSAFVLAEQERQERSRAVQAVAHARLEQACVAADLDFDVHQVRGTPLDLLVREAPFHDLVVTAQPLFPPRTRTRARAAFETRLQEVGHLARRGATPLLVLREAEREIKRVLLVHDGSPASARAIKTHLHQRLWPEAEFRLLASGPDAAAAERNLHAMHGYVRRFRPELEAGYLVGPVRRVLVPYIDKWSADLIVLGIPPARSFFQRFTSDPVPDVLRRTPAALYLTT